MEKPTLNEIYKYLTNEYTEQNFLAECDGLYGEPSEKAENYIDVEEIFDISDCRSFGIEMYITPQIEEEMHRYSDYDGDYDTEITDITGIEDVYVKALWWYDDDDNVVSYTDDEMNELEDKLSELWKS